MHRSIEATLVPARTPGIVDQLQRNPDVVSLSLSRGTSLKPAGDDVLQVHVLNKGIDAVLAAIRDGSGPAPYSITTAEVASIIAPLQQRIIADDVDEAVWEEVEAGLRHNGRLTPNFMLLMAIGAIITVVGFVADVQLQVIAFIAASIIAPGLEPIAKIPLGLVLRRRECLLFGLRSSFIGYGIILLTAAAAFSVLRAAGDATAAGFLEDGMTQSMQQMTPKDWMLSVAGASASILMYLSYRRNVISGPLIALIFIPAVAAAGIALTLGEWAVALRLLGRFGIEVLVTVGTGAAFIYLKQKAVHRRTPLV